MGVFMIFVRYDIPNRIFYTMINYNKLKGELYEKNIKYGLQTDLYGIYITKETNIRSKIIQQFFRDGKNYYCFYSQILNYFNEKLENSKSKTQKKAYIKSVLVKNTRGPVNIYSSLINNIFCLSAYCDLQY